MYTKEEFYNDLIEGRLSAIPDPLYEILRLIVETGEAVIKINTYQRPVKYEDALLKYKIKGVSIYNVNVGSVNALFDMHYVMAVDIKYFIPSLLKFYDKNKDEVEDIYNKQMKSARKLEDDKLRKLRLQNPGVIYRRKHPRETGLVLFSQKIGGLR